MKKIFSTLLLSVCVASLLGTAACSADTGGTEPPAQSMVLNLRTPDTYDMTLGDSYKIVYAVKGSSLGVTFASSDESVVTVDEYGNTEAVGVGEAVITVALKEDPTVKETVAFTVTKNFFYDKTGYINGWVNFDNVNDGYVEILGDQTQLLVSEYSENWYFKCSIDHSGTYTSDDSAGRFGVGSFNVSESVPIGQVMAWFGFIPKVHRKHTYIPYVGGWRVTTNNMDPDIYLTDDMTPMDLTNGATFELIRYGTTHYYSVTAGGETVKYVYDIPAFEGIPTWPGVYSQNQIITVYDYESTSDPEEVLAKLNNFQTAESIAINGVSDVLIAGETYDFTASVLPETTYDKGVKWELTQGLNGVTMTESGSLTVGSGVSGQITVKATSLSDNSVTDSKTYSVIEKPASASGVIDTGMIVAQSGNVSVNGENSVSVTGGENYIPLNAKGEKWIASFTVNEISGNGAIGLLSADNGYMTVAGFNALLTADGARTMQCGLTGDEPISFAYAADGSAVAGSTFTLVKDGTTYYVALNGRLIKKLTVSPGEATTPVIYTSGVAADLSSVSISADGQTVAQTVAGWNYAVGGYVTDNGGGSYTMTQKNFSGAQDINWPPVNDFENGLKSTETFASDFSVSFRLSDIAPMAVNGQYDSKVLVYLRTESKTASVQFVIKGTPAAPVVTFCPNLNDATWIEYEMPEGIDLLNGENQVEIVRKANRVLVYINGTQIFADNVGLYADGYFTDGMQFTPGIGTYLCGATVSDVQFKEAD